VKDSWSNSEAYERYVGRWSSRVAERFLDWLDARTAARWLDMGCGTGALSERIVASQEPNHLIGAVGIFPGDRERTSPGRNVEFRSGSGERLPVEDACIDYAVSGLVLNFVPAKDAAMRELVRVLSPGGIGACYVWDYAEDAQFMRYFWDAAVKLNPSAKDKDEGGRFPICRPKPLQNLFECAGFATCGWRQ
jgi:ubiquinone/menaquinone biosynthesis C-methylase UbiE